MAFTDEWILDNVNEIVRYLNGNPFADRRLIHQWLYISPSIEKLFKKYTRKPTKFNKKAYVRSLNTFLQSTLESNERIKIISPSIYEHIKFIEKLNITKNLEREAYISLWEFLMFLLKKCGESVSGILMTLLSKNVISSYLNSIMDLNVKELDSFKLCEINGEYDNIYECVKTLLEDLKINSATRHRLKECEGFQDILKWEHYGKIKHAKSIFKPLNPEKIREQCFKCGRLEKEEERFKKCGHCKLAFFCSKKCQEDSWKSSGGHNCKNKNKEMKNVNIIK